MPLRGFHAKIPFEAFTAMAHPPLLSPTPTMVSSGSNSTTVPLTSANDGTGWNDIYEAALSDLARKIPSEISLKDYESFVKTSTSPDCATETHVRDALESIRDDGHYRGRFHKFFEFINAMFEPLRLFKTGLDTLCQVQSTGCLVWGSLKILLEVLIN